MKIFLDSANVEALKQYPIIAGMTTNPSIMFKAGIKDYQTYAKSVLSVIGDLPISFEVFADEFSEMERQAKVILSWGGNTYVKIPISNSKGESTLPLIRTLLDAGIKINITAILTEEQTKALHDILKPEDVVIVSIFAGRIADTGVDPIPAMKRAGELYTDLPKAEILWASCREVINIVQAEQCGCHIITAPEDIIKKYSSMKGKDLNSVSLDTVQTFFSDSQKAGFTL